MQYILTEKEYKALKQSKAKREAKEEETLFELCKQVTQYKPVKCSWDSTREPSPWGCIYTECPVCGDYPYEGDSTCECELTEEQEDEFYSKAAPYCDDCPVQNLCPRDQHFSK